MSCSLYAATKNLVPNVTGDGGLGTASKQWRDVNAATGAFSSKLTLGGEPVATTNQAGVIAASVAAAAVAANTNFPNGVALIAPLAFGDPGFDGWLIQFDNSDVHLPLVWTNPIAGWFTTARDLPQSIATWQDLSNSIPDLSGYAPLANPTMTWPDPEEPGFGIRLENTTGDSVRFAGYDTEPGSTPGSVRISRTGDVTASGTINAAAFAGDGSGLTGLNIPSVDPVVAVFSAPPVNLTNKVMSFTATSDVALTHTTNRTSGVAQFTSLYLYAGETNRLVSFNTNWVLWGCGPTNLVASNRWCAVHLMGLGPAENNVHVRFDPQ
jgi:hypothetical protein